VKERGERHQRGSHNATRTNKGMIVTDKHLFVRETCGISRTSEFVRVGVPFPAGELTDGEFLAITGPEEAPQPVQWTVLKRWPDGSAKWLLLDFAASVPAQGSAVYRIVHAGTPFPGDIPAISISPGAEAWQVDTGAALFVVDACCFRPFSRIRSNDRELLAPWGGECLLKPDGERTLAATVESIEAETAGPLRATLRIKGHFGPGNMMSPRFSCRLHFFAQSTRVDLDFTLHNPRPAAHPGGLWDLGDPGSLLFRELTLNFPFTAGAVEEIVCTPEAKSRRIGCRDQAVSLSIYQESSGGDNWRSPVHRNREGGIPIALRGYTVTVRGKRVARGDRATPVVWCGADAHGLAAVLPRFWQEFPKAMTAGRDALNIALFPADFPDLHELQGGEQKTTSVYLDVDASPAGLAWARAPLTVMALPALYLGSGVIADLPSPSATDGDSDPVDRFLPGPIEFFRKREMVDEYGWRHFGDIFADHEGVYTNEPDRFISHYNNQYDVCAGLYRKFMASGDPLWGELASDLARHILDIDLYHTDGDREEYNGGLFWHTDHYISAGLSTHRSFSAEHLYGKDPRSCGGGPGSQHCYTAGLMLHYFLTGNPDFRDAVIGLAEWGIRSLTGPHTVLGAVKGIAGHLRQLRNSASGAKPVFPRYPLNRGTGNTINACLDAFEVSGERRFLERAESLIRGTIHPEDEIDARDLLNAEEAWSYTVFLVAVAKFLDKKCELKEFDCCYAYARASLVAYGKWMACHEYPYLDKPEILEYPNETWPAQDLRKCVVLFHAARHAEPGGQAPFLEKARRLFEAARQELERHHTSSFTRPLALMLQNGWVGARLTRDVHHLPAAASHDRSFGRPTPLLGMPAVVARIAHELARTVRETTLQREIGWLKLRLRS